MPHPFGAHLPPVALTIAGSDSGGGAGIQADLKTFCALGVYGASILTALTAQNTVGVQGVSAVPPEFIAQQFDSVCTDLPVAAAKVGMLATSGVIEVVARKVRQHRLERLVVDPVMVAKSGDRLLAPEAREALVRSLLPLAEVLTPNTEEARDLLGGKAIRSLEDMKEAARALHRLGPRRVLVKGGHITPGAADVLFDGEKIDVFEGRRVDTPHTHGTGCTLSSAIAAGLAWGKPVREAVAAAKEYIQGAIENALPLGKGRGPLNHMYRCWPKGNGLKKAIYRVRPGEAASGPLPVPGGRSLFRILLDDESVGARNFALLFNEFDPGLASTAHKHDKEEHAFYILSGSGSITIEGEAFPVEEGDAIFVPPGAMHQISSRGDRPLKYIVIYSPPGPNVALREKGAYGLAGGVS